MKQLLLESIRIDGTQSRAAIHEETVAEYVEALAGGAKMPPIAVFFDGSDHWLADGFHRFLAHQRAEKRHILAEVKNGTKEDAMWSSAGANVDHGLRRTNADKRKAVEMALSLRPDLSLLAIANHCGVSDRFVQLMKPKCQVVNRSPPDLVTGVDGKRYPVPPSRPPQRPPAAPPAAPQPPVRTPPPVHNPPPSPVVPPAPVPTRKPGPQTGQVDETGHPIPDHLIPLWESRAIIRDLLAQISDVRCTISEHGGEPLYAELNTSSCMASLNSVYDMIKATAPHAVCPWCHGTLSDQCRGCRGRGMIGSFAWGRVPAGLRKGRK